MAKIIKLGDKPTKFSFNIDAKELDTAIARASAVISSSASNVKGFIIAAAKGKLALIGFNPDSFIYLQLKTGKSEGEGAFGFAAQHVQGLIKGRGEMAFKFNGSEAEFKTVKGRYSGKLVTLPVTGDQVTLINSTFGKGEGQAGQAATLPRHVLDHLKEAVAMTGIKDVYTGNALLAYMVLNDKGILTVSAHDNFHFSHYRVKLKADGVTFQAALPSSHFIIIDKLVEGEEAKFMIRSQNMRVEGDNFVLILPSHQAEEASFDLITKYIKDMDKPAMECAYDHDQMAGIIDNLFTLHAVNTSFDISAKKGVDQLAIVFNTSNGSAQDSIKVKADPTATVSARVDPRMLRDLTGLVRGQGDTKFGIIKDTAVRIVCKTKSGATVNLISAMAE